jgi:hypothetical protein
MLVSFLKQNETLELGSGSRIRTRIQNPDPYLYQFFGSLSLLLIQIRGPAPLVTDSDHTISFVYCQKMLLFATYYLNTYI